MGTNLLYLCGSGAFGTLCFPWLILYGTWLQLLQRINGMGRSWAQKGANLFTCLSITAQKQWDETLVLVLGGMGRLLRPHFKILHRLDSFKQGWDSFLTFVQESVLNGSEEVAVAAIMSMHSVLVFHDLKVRFLGFVVVISDQFSFFWTLVWRFHM
jgi:hypothetical protein